MNEVRPNPGRMRSVASAMHHGTVLMECVLVLPLLTLLIFAIVQFALIWYAQIMTHYAAYNAARAALVYNPAEYSKDGVFLQRSGVCWRAAVQSLSWVASSPSEESDFRIPGLTAGPLYASKVEQQVRISPQSFEGTVDPVVAIQVEFDYPLHVPVIGHMLSYFTHAADSRSELEIWGWKPDAQGELLVQSVTSAHPLAGEYVTLHANCVLPKPWQTTRFARIPESER